ncbi:unnamed protein product [Fusarium graminearum]|nr:hypothetical protein FGRA07_00759 [Fusarium graminearum]CZS78048.1 unnamed protein product [Fusarium graminearum]
MPYSNLESLSWKDAWVPALAKRLLTGLTDLTQKSAGKAIIDHPTTSDRDHILISLDPCSASRNSSTPGSQYQACFGFSDDYTPVLSYWGIFTLAKRLKWCPTKLGR